MRKIANVNERHGVTPHFRVCSRGAPQSARTERQARNPKSLILRKRPRTSSGADCAKQGSHVPPASLKRAWSPKRLLYRSSLPPCAQSFYRKASRSARSNSARPRGATRRIRRFRLHALRGAYPRTVNPAADCYRYSVPRARRRRLACLNDHGTFGHTSADLSTSDPIGHCIRGRTAAWKTASRVSAKHATAGFSQYAVVHTRVAVENNASTQALVQQYGPSSHAGPLHRFELAMGSRQLWRSFSTVANNSSTLFSLPYCRSQQIRHVNAV
jgi:hypothetical protein